MLDTNHRITCWTAGAAKLYGFTQADALGKPAHELLQTRFPEPYDQIRARLFAEGRWSGELEQTTWDGRRLVVATHWVLRRDKNGAPAAILEVNNDITERKRAEQRFRLAVEAAPNAMLMVNLNGEIVLVAPWSGSTAWMFGEPRFWIISPRKTARRSRARRSRG